MFAVVSDQSQTWLRVMKKSYKEVT